jgi:hypothetical protein
MNENEIISSTNEEQPVWKEEWKNMPEFVQDKKRPYAQITFRFECEQDLQEFAKLIGQKLTNKTKSAWYPYKSHWGTGRKLWVDENESDNK